MAGSRILWGLGGAAPIETPAVLLFVVAACGGASQTEHTVTVAPVPTCQCPQAPPPADASPRFTQARTPEMAALAKRRLELAGRRIPIISKMYETGRSTLSEVLDAHRELALAARDGGLAHAELRLMLEQHRDAVKQLRDLTQKLFTMGVVTEEAVMHADLGVVEAEYWLAEMNAGR